ncbi:glycosyltransferase family 34 protein [Amniculicola lignicola CBS 123094]|uniref:Glycosyltransferase family 34 protein n=1 Tax=Amniculicola lignicola CBS 123094 TaxID=1392246 RepID=A0A6A5VZF1_9PLEO|nr:glycosyltransferase family 34 protein [Amniculicola lignicola CBS 123094]
MLFRKGSHSVLLFLALCAFLGWHFSRGPRLEGTSDVAQVPGKTESKAPVKKGPRIAIVTYATYEKSYIHLSLRNKDHYARMQGYDFIVDYELHTDRGATWWKFNMMERLIKKRKWDWIWFVDFDTLVTNMQIKLEDIIDATLANVTSPAEIDWLKTHDCNGLNTGSYMVRGTSDRPIDFIQKTYKIHDEAKETGKQMSEQDAMVQLMKNEPAEMARTIQVPQWKLNAFPKEIACFDESRQVWEPGMFMLHFAGAWAHVKGDDPTGQLMTRYEPEIQWGHWEDFYEQPRPGYTNF